MSKVESVIGRVRNYLDSRPAVSPSPLLSELDLRSVLKLEAGACHPIILSVGPVKGKLRATVATMVGEDKSFSNMFPVDDYGAARIAFMKMRERGVKIGVVAIDLETIRYGENWTDLVKDIRHKEPTTKIILFGDVPRKQRREFGIDRVVRNP
jgi:hypothetical protein